MRSPDTHARNLHSNKDIWTRGRNGIRIYL